MTWLEALLLGLVQGLTEFLPVSSSGHLVLGSVILGIETKDNLLFSVLLHGATALSTIIVFRKDIFTLIKECLKFKWNESTRYASMIILSIIPVGVIGLLFEDQIEAFFGGKVLFVSGMLMITAVLLTASYLMGETKGKINFSKAFVIGLAQAIAILPGISRSGATIGTALLLGVKREAAARFSFLMVLIPILGATALKLKDYFENPSVADGISSSALSAGFIAALISGIIACRWMIALVNKGRLIYFAIYCFIISIIGLISYL